jgi:hypothetical protein
MSGSLPVAQRDFRGWTPIHLFRFGPEPLVLWSRLGVERFDAPLFEQTVSTALRTPLAALLQRTTSLAEMIEIADREPALEPGGFIFHVSRCGSTLVSQMFARLARFMVISEAQPLVAVLNESRISELERRRAFQALVRLYGRCATGAETGYLLKLEPRHLLDWGVVAELFPDVPRLVLYRDPVEVLVSIFRSVPEAAMVGAIDPARLGPPTQVPHTNEEYAAFVIARFFAAAAELAQVPGSLVVNYRELPDAVFSRIEPHFGVKLSESDRAAMREATRVYAKDATRRSEFIADSAAKQAAAGERIRRLARVGFPASYAALEAADQRGLSHR